MFRYGLNNYFKIWKLKKTHKKQKQNNNNNKQTKKTTTNNQQTKQPNNIQTNNKSKTISVKRDIQNTNLVLAIKYVIWDHNVMAKLPDL